MGRRSVPNGETVARAVSRYGGKAIVRAHFPGHKGRSLPTTWLKTLSQRGETQVARGLSTVYEFDVTEGQGLDNLLYPSGCIRNTEDWISGVFGARRSLISTGGATAGVLAAILAVRMLHPERKKAIVTRGAHRSAISALILSGLEPVFVYPRYSHWLGGYLPALPEEVMPVLSAHSEEAACLFLVNPTYYGLHADISQTIAEAHKRHVPVIVDEAHGSHYALSGRLPESALRTGADIVVHGIHKTLPVLTQAGLVHTGRTSVIPDDLLEEAFRLVHTSSPSYVVMSSVEIGIRTAIETDWVDSGVRLASTVRSALTEMPELFINQELLLQASVDEEIVDEKVRDSVWCGALRGKYRWDPERLSISAFDRTIPGADIARALADEGIYAEMFGLRDVLLVITGSDDDKSAFRMVQGLRRIPDRLPRRSKAPVPVCPPRAKTRMSPRAAFFSSRVLTKLREASGRTAAEMVMVYPPGCPVLVPGEEISDEAVEYIRQCVSEDLFVAGVYVNESEMMLACVESW